MTKINKINFTLQLLLYAVKFQQVLLDLVLRDIDFFF